VWVTEKDPSAHMSSDRGVGGRQKMWVTKKTLPAVFRATEEVGGRQEVWVTRKNPSTRVSSDVRGWWQAESVGDEKIPLCLCLSDGGVGGRQKMWVTKKNPSPAFRAMEGVGGR
jgi:hypothetical protein